MKYYEYNKINVMEKTSLKNHCMGERKMGQGTFTEKRFFSFIPIYPPAHSMSLNVGTWMSLKREWDDI